jgi:starvation-inducible DNA-binding protein
MADDVAERLAALGGVAQGTPGSLVKERTWDDYSIGRADAIAHLGALDVVYTGILESLREAVEVAGEIDPATEDLLIEQLRDLEQFQWFVRAHLESAGGTLATADASTEKDGAAGGAAPAAGPGIAARAPGCADPPPPGAPARWSACPAGWRTIA